MASSVPYDDRRDHLLHTAARVFAERGFHATSMRDLARETGMSLSGMYHYVRGKDDLLFQIQERCFTRVYEGAKAAVGEGDEAVDALHRFIRHHVTFFAEHMSEMKVLSHEAESLTGDRLASINQIKRSYVDLLVSLIRRARNGDDPATVTRVAAYALFGMMNWIYTWYDATGPVAPEALADQFADLFLHGYLATEPSISDGG